MYTGLDVPVVPVALDSGLYWQRNSLILWPGTARAKFLHRSCRDSAPRRSKRPSSSASKAQTNRLILEAVERGLSRPISDEMRDKLQALGRCRTYYILTVHRL